MLPALDPSNGPVLGRRRGALASMRRRNRFRDPRSVALNVIPLVDVTFLLMIFFVIAGAFEVWEGVLASRMLSTGAGGAAPLPLSPIVVRLSHRGPADDYAIRIDSVARAPEDFRELTERLRRMQEQSGFDEQTPVVIVAEDKVRWDHVVSCWNCAARAGYRSIAFGQPEGP